LTVTLPWSKITFDHISDHFQSDFKTSYPGVAQLVGRLVWELRDEPPLLNAPVSNAVAALVKSSLDSKPSVV